MSTTQSTEQQIGAGGTPAVDAPTDELLPPYVARAINPRGLSDGQVEALHEVARRVQQQTAFDIENPRDVSAIARFISAGGNAIVAFDYMFCWVSHPHEAAVHHMLGDVKARNPERKPASIAIRPGKLGRLLDTGSRERDRLTIAFMNALFDRIGAGVRFMPSSVVPRHLCLAQDGVMLAQVIVPHVSSAFYRVLDEFERLTGLDMVAITSANRTDERGPHYRLKDALATLGAAVPILSPGDEELRKQQIWQVQARMQAVRPGRPSPEERALQRRAGVPPTPEELWPFKLSSTTIVGACTYHEDHGVLTLTVKLLRHGSVHANEIGQIVEAIDAALQVQTGGSTRIRMSDEPPPSRLWVRRYGQL